MVEMKRNEAFFNQFTKYSDGAWAVGWNTVTQNLVHNSVMDSVNVAGRDVLDIGCGDGQLLFNLLLNDQKPGRFVGIDIVKKLVAKAIDRFYALPRTEDIDVHFQESEALAYLGKQDNGEFDFVTSIGVLDLMETDDEVEHRMYLREVIREMYRVSTEGIVLAVQSERALEHREGQYYVDPVSMLGFVINEFGDRFRLDHSFAQHYMVLTIYKSQFPWNSLEAPKYSPPERQE